MDVLSYFQEAPTKRDWVALERILRYLKGTIDVGLVYTFSRFDTNILVAYADVSYTADRSDRKSINGFVMEISLHGA